MPTKCLLSLFSKKKIIHLLIVVATIFSPGFTAKKARFKSIALSKSQTFACFCFFFVGSSAVFSTFLSLRPQLMVLVVINCIAVVTVILMWIYPCVRWGILMFWAVILGALRLAWAVPAFVPNAVSFYNGQKITWIGYVDDYPDQQRDKTNYVVQAQEIVAGSQRPIVRGRVLLHAPLVPVWQYGDILKITCRLQAPVREAGSTFYYDKYLAGERVFSVCNFASIQKVGTRITGFYGFIFRCKNWVTRAVNGLWNEPESSLMAGILYGARGGFDDETKADFSRAGITHIIAVSGSNVTIVVGMISYLLILIGFYRQQAFYGILVFLAVFVLFTGASASVVRAAIMASLVLVEKQLGRPGSKGKILIFTVAIMVVDNPFIILFDVGFQLSFLATVGLMYVLPVLERWLRQKHTWPKNVFLSYGIKTLLETSSATLTTLPIIAYTFGQISLAAPLMNVAVLWLVSPLMVCGFAATILALGAEFLVWLWPLAQVVAGVGYAGLAFIIRLSQVVGERENAAVVAHISWLGLMVGYAILIAIWYFLAKKYEQK